MEASRRPAAVLSSKVYNEAELVFHMLEDKDRKCVSSLDTLTLMRAMGMNPIQAEIDILQQSMAPLIAELDDLRLEEERKKEAIRKKEEAKLGKGGDAKDKDAKAKDAKAKDAKAKDAKAKDGKDGKKDGEPGKEGEAAEGEEGEDGKPKKRVLTDPPEEIKNIDWHIFITNVEPLYKDAAAEREEIIEALRVFDKTGSGKITIKEIAEIVKTNGESVLSPAELKQLLEAFPMTHPIDFGEFADRINGTYQPPPPPTAEELAKIEEERREAEEAAKKAAQEDDFDALLGSGNVAKEPTSPAGAAPAAAAAEGADAAAVEAPPAAEPAA